MLANAQRHNITARWRAGGGLQAIRPRLPDCRSDARFAAGDGEDIKSIEQAAHGAYFTAINSNDVDTLLADLTDDIVYQSPGEPEIVGKAAVRKWLAEYFGTARTHWEKKSIGFVVSGEWAFERYTYRSTDSGKKAGAVTTDVGRASTSSAVAAMDAGV